MRQRIQKIIGQSGICSRRKAEQLILQKRVFIKTTKKRDLQKRIEALQQKNKKLRIYKDLTRDLGDNPDEIKLKLNQIYDWNEQK